MRDLPWPHAPTHQLSENGTFIVTAGTYLKEHYFRADNRLEVMERGLLSVAHDFGWHLHAWAVFSNHYHFIADSPSREDGAATLSPMLGTLHLKLARWINREDAMPERKVWHNFFETQLTHRRSYLARLHCVHANAVRHGLVAVASQYPWCSAAWFERPSSPAIVKSIYRFKIDRLKVGDDFEPVMPE